MQVWKTRDFPPYTCPVSALTLCFSCKFLDSPGNSGNFDPPGEILCTPGKFCCFFRKRSEYGPILKVKCRKNWPKIIDFSTFLTIFANFPGPGGPPGGVPPPDPKNAVLHCRVEFSRFWPKTVGGPACANFRFFKIQFATFVWVFAVFFFYLFFLGLYYPPEGGEGEWF